MARTRAALALVVVAAVALTLVSGGASTDPRTPPPLPGMPPPFLTVAVLGDGGLTAGVDAYGDIVDLRAPGPAGLALIDNPSGRQAAGTVSAGTGIVPRARFDDGPQLPLWRADSVRQRYLPGTNVLRTEAGFAADELRIECAAAGGRVGCLSSSDGPRALMVSYGRDLNGGGDRVHLDDEPAQRIVAGAIRSDRRRLLRDRRLGARAPVWARRMYERSLLVMRALTDRRSGAVAAGARDGWAFVWPRDAGAVAIALAATGQRTQARRTARFLLGLDLEAAARFDGDGEPVPGRAAQGDAGGWVAAAAAAADLGAPARRESWQGRADYQEKSPGEYLANALASLDGPKTSHRSENSALRPASRGFLTGRGLVRAEDAGLDSAAAWAVRPFPHPGLFAAASRTLLALPRLQERRFGPGAARFGLIPSEDWPGADPWSAPSAWSAWSLAALADRARGTAVAARERRAALRLLAALRRAATPAGLLPERVDARSGVPRSTAPLAWSHAFVALAMLQLWPGTRQRDSQ